MQADYRALLPAPPVMVPIVPMPMEFVLKGAERSRGDTANIGRFCRGRGWYAADVDAALVANRLSRVKGFQHVGVDLPEWIAPLQGVEKSEPSIRFNSVVPGIDLGNGISHAREELGEIAGGGRVG